MVSAEGLLTHTVGTLQHQKLMGARRFELPEPCLQLAGF